MFETYKKHFVVASAVLPDYRSDENGRMEEIYNEHYIYSDGRLIPGRSKWAPTVNVYWMEDGRPRSKRWGVSHFKGSFPTKEEAEKEAHLFAKKWIDDGKPNLEP